MAMMSQTDLEDLADDKIKLFKDFLAAEPPAHNGESLLELWEKLYDDDIKNTVVETVNGPSDDETNPVFPYEKLQAVVQDGGSWKWPRMWQKFDELERRGTRFREGEALNFNQPNKNPNLKPLRVLVVGGGPVGLRLSIELVLGGHKVTLFEKRREERDGDGELTALGFTNRINRPHMWPFVRNDLAKLNGKDFMSRQMCYPVFTEPDTSSIGIDELQVLLMKNLLLMGVDFRLGVGYNDAKVITDPKTLRPMWQVDCSYDEHAAEYFGKTPGKNKEIFDCLVGCDGPRSTVRDTQAKHFGNIEKRKFMDCVGIVANVRKVPRKRLKEMGFEYGQEPNDMNRTKMVFKDFFKKINDEAGADLENLIYYKASFHNYTILTPKRQNLIDNGLSGRVYSFSAARDKTGEKAAEKAKLKEYCAKALRAAGIPVDPTAENEGFVNAPNDCMAFDFAECWNTKKSVVFNLPPADYDVELHGDWMGKRLIPFVALAGDALLEPFWPMGLGLKRGWQAIMDTCYAIDNLYNRTCFCTRLGKDPETFTWDEHYEALQDQISTNFEYCNRLKVGDELGKGEYAEKGAVMTQLKKLWKDAEKPMFEVEIDPWTRYAPLEKEEGDKWKLTLKDPDAPLHPKVSKALAIKEFYESVSKGGSNNEITYNGKKLISINGRVLAGKGTGGGYKPNLRQSFSNKPTGSVPKPPQIKPEEVATQSAKFKENLTNTVLAAKIEDHVQQTHQTKTTDHKSTSRRTSNVGMAAVLKLPGMAPQPKDEKESRAQQEVLHQLGHVVPDHVGDSVQDAAEAMWDRMHEKHLSPAQEAELAHVRHMIEALTKSLESYRQAEKSLLMSGRK